MRCSQTIGGEIQADDFWNRKNLNLRVVRDRRLNGSDNSVNCWNTRQHAFGIGHTSNLHLHHSIKCFTDGDGRRKEGNKSETDVSFSTSLNCSTVLRVKIPKKDRVERKCRALYPKHDGMSRNIRAPIKTKSQGT